ncbi:inositol 1,4,5-trisphosphate receptor type 1-like isoform X2 [Corticium candelabrum]|uniref:inositol 1,4,5-trisphosphate receptor type 1-like isoform X2 n=1 Tax=Corticium candelabrum TaxID=121492 RepID=UPI002E27395B|nr:inositol 1,4,5-trisphosphate receptor type 1-like isoform X2 [Corticium candelabrum]
MSVAVSVQESRDAKSPNLPNIHAAAFHVLAPNKYKAQKKLQKFQNEIGNISKSQMSPSQLENLRILEKNYQAECDDNRQEQQRQHNKPLEYGHVVQLQHVFTKRFLSVSTTLTSQVEPTNMQVELREFNAKHGRFRVLPRYKVRAIGDRVMVGDQIQLESVKTEGQFIHCSHATFGEHSTETTGKELNLSATQSALTVISHFTPKVEHGPNDLKASSVIRLYHREEEAYLAAEGSFAEEKPVENVHLRVRHPLVAKPHSLLPSTSAITYWQIELESSPASGEVMRWEQRCRLRHVCTRQYLALLPGPGTSQVSLTTDTGLSSVFRLFPVIQEGDSITYDSYCRIEHVETGQWLHARKAEYKRQAHKLVRQQSTSMERLDWDTAILRQIGSSPQMNYDDAFTIQQVDEELVDIFNYVAGMVPVVQQYITARKRNKLLTTKTADRMQKALTELGDFQIVNGEPVKDRQKLLRNLRLLDLLVDLLKLYDPNRDDAMKQRSVCQHAYRALEKYLVGNSRKNELYVAKYIPWYQTQIGLGLNAETMVMELVRDNRKIVDRIEESQIDKFIEFLQKKRDHRYLDFLGVLCVCDGVAIPSNQDYITKKLLQDTRSIVYLTEVGSALKPPRDRSQVYMSQDQGNTWVGLRDFTKNQEHKPTEEFNFLQRQLDLFGKLCYGRNKYVIDVITKDLCYLTWNEAFICLKDELLPDNLRANYCELIVGLFVDVDDNRSVLDKLCLSYVYDKVEAKPYSRAADDPQEAITGVRMAFFPELRNWIADFMQMNQDMTASNIGHNQLVEQVLRLVHYLVRFGYYANIEDIHTLLRPLLSVLDGTNDKPFEGAKKERHSEALKQYQLEGRFKHNPQNTAVVDAKHMAMQVLELLFNFRFNIRLERFIYQFKAASEGRTDILFRQSTRHGRFPLSSRVQSSHGQRQMLDSTGLTRLMNADCDVLADDAFAEFTNDQLEGILQESAYFEDKNLVAILKDLSDYDYDKMVVESMKLMSRYFSAHSTLFERAVQAQVLIHPKSVAVYQRVDQTLPTLRRLVSAKLTQEQERTVVKLIDEYTRMCILDPEADVDEPHKMNQKILYNFGVLADIFDILDKEIDIRLAQYEGLREIFRKCFRFLQAMARDNTVVQNRLFDRLDKLLGVHGTEAELADALTEVFTGNQDMCLKIRGDQVQKIVELLAQHQLNASEFLELLKAVVKVEELDLPLKRNQAFVMTYINQNRAKLAWIIERDTADKRKQLLKAGDMDDPELSYLTRLVDLLATCAEGENRFIESMCQNIFSIEDLLEILTDPEISHACKRPYLRFFVWVYLNTAGGKVDSGAADLVHDRDMWNFMKLLNDSLKRLSASVRGMERDTKKMQSVKMSLKAQRRKFDTPSKTALLAAKKVDQHKPAEGRVLEEGFLVYIFEAVLPLLHVFYTEYYRPEDESHRMEIQISKALTQNLLQISDEISRFVADENQFRLLHSTVTAMLNQESLQFSDEMITKFQQLSVDSQVDVRSEAMKRYEREFHNEEKRNDCLNQFVVNFQKAYEGKNTVRAQLEFPSDEEYCECGGDEDLPLGKEFQDHVACFTNRSGGVETHGAKLVEQLHISYSNPDLGRMSEAERLQQEQTSIASLQVLRAIIHNQIKQLPDDESGHSKAYVKGLKRVRLVQDALNAFEAPLKIIPLLSDSNDNIVRETLALLATMLFAGNRSVQAGFEHYFLHTREEMFFIDVQGRLRRSIVATRERRALLAQHRAKVSKSKEMMETLRLKTQGKSAVNTTLAAAGKAADEIELKELEIKEGVHEVEDASDALRFRDDGYIELVLRIMGYMCDGHNTVLQDYLRVQPDNIRSLNLVAETTTYLQLFFGGINEDNVELVTQVFDTLIEFLSGNQENQTVAFDYQIIDAINDVLRMDTKHWKDHGAALRLKQSAMTVLQSMIEENDPKTIRLAREILETVHVESLYENMAAAFEEARQIPGDDGEDARTLAFSIHHILLALQDFGQKIQGKKWQFRYNPSGEELGAESILAEDTMSVEILRDDEIQKVYFRVRKKSALRDEVKEHLKWNISRESPTDKLRDFLDWAQDIRSDINFQQKVRKHWLASLFIAGRLVWHWSLLVLSLVLNIFLLATWTSPRDFDKHFPEVEDYFYPVLFSLGGIHLFLSFCMVVTFYLSNWNNFVFPSFVYTIFQRDLPKESHSAMNYFGLQSLFFSGFLTCSVLALFFDGYFYCYHLFIIVVNNDILGRVLQSITRNGKSLLWVAALMVIIIYVYTVISFAFLRESFHRDEGLFCENLGQCFVTSLKFGLLSGGGLGEALQSRTFSFHEPGLRTIFDLSFFIIITIIALNIVFGIIVDTFSELRDEKWKAQADMASVCFICGNASFEFEKRGNGFDHHVKEEHNMWAYLFFFIHLNTILPNDYTSTEEFVANKLKHDEIDFFPLNRALSLAETEDKSAQELSELKRMVQQLLDRHEREDANQRRHQERQEQRKWKRKHKLATEADEEEEEDEITTI